jgi:methionyl aminopeptidase
MSYIEATDTSLRKTGQIKLHGPSAFAGMRKAGALVAKCLDELTDIVKPGLPTSGIDDFVRDFAFSNGAYPATPDVCRRANRAQGRAADRSHL